MNELIIVSAFVLDRLFGDPRWFPHPVRGIGWFIQRFEFLFRRFAGGARAEKAAGIVLVVLTVSTVYVLARLLILSSFRISPHVGFVVSVVLAYTTLAARDLADAARTILGKLHAGDIASARKDLSWIVGRDTSALDEQDISRAVIETVAENASDGVIAPLFYLALGGPALALAYKAVNTLDSMIGYKNDQYRHFGWAAARLDDLANFIPARITAVLICLAADIERLLKPAASLDASNAEFETRDPERHSPWHIMLRDGRNHASPNSGYPEAAMAGALGVRLGGPSTYGGQVSVKPFIGDALCSFDKKAIEKSVRIMYSASLCAAAGAVSVLFLL